MICCIVKASNILRWSGAITQHHKEMVRALLDYGASIEQPGDENNWNALHYAAAWGIQT